MSPNPHAKKLQLTITGQMDQQAYENYLTQINLGRIREIADQYYDDSLEIFSGGVTYDKANLLRMMEVTAEQLVESFELLNFYQAEDGIAAEVKTTFVAKNDVVKAPFEESCFPEAYVDLKKGESFVAHTLFTYKIKDGKFVLSRGFAA
jgi:ketosteroid isomerase-like protein